MLLELTHRNRLKKIRYIISNPIDEEHRDVAKIVQENSDAIALPPAKSKNIGDDEMADTGQKDYLIDLAEEKKVHAGHLCEEMFDHEFDKATVGEVNEMIRVLNRV